MSNKKLIGTALAAAAALAFVTAPFTSTVASAHAKVKCYGVNSCKGKSQCKTAQCLQRPRHEDGIRQTLQEAGRHRRRNEVVC